MKRAAGSSPLFDYREFRVRERMRLINQLRLRAALWLLSGLPENVWLGRNKGAYSGTTAWQAGRLDSRGVLQGYELTKVFDARSTTTR